MSETDELTLGIIDGRLVLSIGIQTLGVAALTGDYFTFDEGAAKVTDAAVFAKAILSELRREEEDGTTLVHRMLDRAAELAVEGGCEGVRLPGDTPA